MSGNDATISGDYDLNFQINNILRDWETLSISLECNALRKDFNDNTGFGPSIFNDNNTIEIPIMDLCVENAFIKRMVDWRDSLIATEVEKAKKEKSYDYQKFLDLKKLFGE